MSGPSSAVLVTLFIFAYMILKTHRRTKNQKLDSWNLLEPYMLLAWLMGMLTWIIYVSIIEEGSDTLGNLIHKLTGE